MKHFQVLAWVCLPSHIRFGDYVDIMYMQVSSQVPEPSDKDETVEFSLRNGETTDKEHKLRQHLQNRRYLVVLDGLANISDWNSLFGMLPNDNNGSRILLTAQLNVNEIKHIDPLVVPLELSCLDEIHGEELFCQRVFGIKTPPEIYRSKAYYEKVHKISTGLPLAIIVLAGVLQSKVMPLEWDDVFKQLECNGQPKPIRSIWSLAFDDLPHYLKPCFLYFASISENVIVYPDRLVCLWIAEGFIVPTKAQTLEDVGLDYLKELVSRGLVQVMEKDAGGCIKLVTIHNLLHAFVESEAEESCFLEIHHHANVLNPHAVRRLAIQNYVDPYINIPNAFPKLRSLLCVFAEDQRSSSSFEGQQAQSLFGNIADLFLRSCGISESAGLETVHGLYFLQGSRFLRVIDLNGLNMQQLPNEIGNIIHLRYLGIRNSNLKKLPSSISKLDNLQTLDVRKTNVESTVDEFWEIQALRHVLAEEMLLPKCSVPLNNLMTLNGVAPSSSWDEELCPLNYMTSLCSLTLSGISKLNTNTLQGALKKLEFLVYLNLSGEVLPSNMFTDSSMRRLQVLILHELSQLFMGKLVMLPCLAEMELLDGLYTETTMLVPERGFQRLKYLKLKNLDTIIQELVIEKGAMPMLSVLAMFGCNKLKILEGLECLVHLQEVVIYNMEDIVVDEKILSKIKCLATPTMVTSRVIAGSWLRRLHIDAHEQFIPVASESESLLEGADPVVGKSTDVIQVHYDAGAWTMSSLDKHVTDK